MGKMWFSIYDFSFDYKGPEPPFADASQFEWANIFEQNYEQVKKELQDFLVDNQLVSYFSQVMVKKPNTWKTISLRTWGIEHFKTLKHFPFTSALIKKYPEIVSVSFSMLSPNSAILPHCGDTNAIYRCHMGIEVPAGLPDCGIRVRNESVAWQNGKWLAFIDAYSHQAWNNTSKERYVFIVDVMRKEYKAKQKFVCSTVATSLFLQKRVSKLTSMPRFARVAARSFRPLIQAGIFLVNKLKVY